jgi:Flp pilus assembly protein TadG
MSSLRIHAEELKARRCSSSKQGQSTIEFALVVPVLIVLLLVVADFGQVLFVSIAVNNAARAGAQFGSQTNTNAANSTGIQRAACNDYGVSNLGACQSILSPTTSQCTCLSLSPQTPANCAASYCANSPQATYVTVNTSASFSTILALQFLGIPSTMTLTGKAIMQVQQN